MRIVCRRALTNASNACNSNKNALWYPPTMFQHICDHCGAEFETDRRSSRFCSLKCNGARNSEKRKSQPPAWLKCSSCWAAIGFGLKKTSERFLTNKGTLSLAWRQHGITRTAPPNKSWNEYVRCKLAESRKIELMMVDPPHCFPDWGILAKRWKASQAYYARPYAEWTEDEKRQHNAKCQRRHREKWENDEKFRESHRKRRRKWKKANKDKVRKYVRRSVARRKKRDPGFRVQCNMRSRFREIMAKAREGGNKWNNKLIGCTSEHLALHLESKFTNRMTWENYGTYWHVDHIIPCNSFDHTNPEEVAKCWHWTNLQPLTAKENLSKSDKIIDSQTSLLLSA